LSVTRIEPRENRGYHLGRHSTSPEQLHVDKVATEKNEVGVEGSGFSDDALEARNIVGMGAGMKIGKKNYSERMRPPRPTIDYEPQSANQMRTRPSNALKATFSAELVAKGWPRNGANQTIPQNLPKHISIQAIIPTSDRDLARRDQMASPSTLDYATIRLKSERALWSQWRLERHRGPTHLETIPCLFTGREQAMSQPPTRQHR